MPFSTLTLLALLVPGSAYAVEVTGQIRGTVVDKDGLSIPGATISVSGPALMGGATAVTDADGRFRITSLPPGEYVVVATKEGFLTYRATGVLVITGSAANLDVELKPAVGTETIVIEEVRPAVDTRSVSSGAVLTRETMRDIPAAGRDYQGVTAVAPGVVDNGGGNPNVRGAFSSGNQYYVDGVNTTDVITGTFSQNMNYDTIEEVQVVTGGMDAEYGRSLGGAVNIVTRSGGNEFHGDAQFLYSDENLRVYEPLEGEEDASEYQNQQLALNLGGPIIKDKLWFFVNLQGDLFVRATPVTEEVGRPADMPVEPRRWRSLYAFGKLTFQPTSKHKVWFQGQGDPTYIKNVEQSPYTLPKGETIQEQGGYSLQAGHLWTPSSRAILQTQAYWQRSSIDYYSVACEDQQGDLEGCIRNLDDAWLAWDPDAFNGGVFPYGYLGDRYRASLSSALTLFWEGLGDHQSKTGFSAEYLRSVDIFPGVTDWTFKTYTDDPANLDTYENFAQIRYDNELEADLEGALVSYYLQDVWNPVPRLTVRPGLRLDWGRFANDVGSVAFSKATLAPRIGLAWDLTNDNRTSVHAYYGRFYDSGFLAVADLLHTKSQGYSYYLWDAEAQDWASDPAYSYAASNPIHDDLRNPWSDEFDIGLSRDLGDGWALDLTFTYEHSQNFWEDDEVNLIWNEAGTDVIGYRNGSPEVIFRIRTPDEAFVEYTSLELAASRQFNDNFGILGSYVWSRAYGTNDDQFATGVFDIPQQSPYEVGLLSYDRPHVLKMLGSFRDPEAVRFSDTMKLGYLYGWNLQFASGLPYRGVYYNNYYQDWYNYQEALDGTYRLPMESQVDLKAGVTLAAGPTRWDLTVECFNVFNDRTVTSVDTTYGNTTGDGSYLDDEGYALYGRPLTRQNPRYFQLGLRGEF